MRHVYILYKDALYNQLGFEGINLHLFSLQRHQSEEIEKYQNRSETSAKIDKKMSSVGFQDSQKSSINFELSLDKSCDAGDDLSQRIEEFKSQNPEDVEELKRCIQDVLGEAERTAQEKLDKKLVSSRVFDIHCCQGKLKNYSAVIDRKADNRIQMIRRTCLLNHITCFHVNLSLHI